MLELLQCSIPLCKIPETRRLLQEVENIKRRGRREAALYGDEEEKRHATGGEKENRARIASAPKPQNPTGSTAEDVSTLSSWSRPPTSSMGAEASAAGGAKQKRKRRARDGYMLLSCHALRRLQLAMYRVRIKE